MKTNKKGHFTPPPHLRKINYPLLFFILFAGATLTSCYDDNNISPLWAVVSDHEQRLSDLEEWQDQVNQNIESLQRLLNTTDYITAVTPLMEGGQEVGYTITFLNSDPINIYHGAQGDEGDKGEPGEQGDDGHTPQIGLTQGTDGNWYWTLDGELMLDKDNNPIRANGEDGQQGQQGQPGQSGASAPTPQIKLGSTIDSGAIGTDGGTVDPAAWYLSVDGGQTWYRITGDKGEQGDEGDKGDKGDAWLACAPEKSADGLYYTFTFSDDDNTDLSDNPTFKVPVYQAFSLGTGVLELNPGTSKEIDIVLPAGTTADDYRTLVAQITPEGTDGTYTDISTRAADAGGWSVEGDLQGKKVTVTAEATAQAAKALLRVTLIRNDGSEVTASCIVSLSHVIDEATKTYTVYTPQGLRAWADIYWDYNCTLAADIDMSGQTWPRIGGYSRTFDGAGHIIRNLNATTGFIDMLSSGGIVKNLLLVDANISGNAYAGGIVGNMIEGTVIACAVSGCTVKGMSCAGGIAGMTDIGLTCSVTACYAAFCKIQGQEATSGHIAGMGVLDSFSACYYDGIGNGLGGHQDQSGKVEWASNWPVAIIGKMNQLLSTHDYQWAENTDPATQATLPLVLVPNPTVQ